jgi:hypothetical protein
LLGLDRIREIEILGKYFEPHQIILEKRVKNARKNILIPAIGLS